MWNFWLSWEGKNLFIPCFLVLMHGLHSKADVCETPPFSCSPWYDPPIPPKCWCNDGNIAVFKCSLTGEWERPCKCLELKNPQNGYIDYSRSSGGNQGYPLQTTAEYKCFNDYASRTERRRTCFDGGWTISSHSFSCEKICKPLGSLWFKYSVNMIGSGYPVGTTAHYPCNKIGDLQTSFYYHKCTANGWISLSGKFGCLALPKVIPPVQLKYYGKTEHYLCSNLHSYPPGTKAFYSCGGQVALQRLNCTDSGKWDIHPPIKYVCGTTPTSTTASKTLHPKDVQTLVIVGGSTGAILGALIILVVIVSCQRRLHYHRLRRARLRHRQDQDAFSAFITYHRDVRLLLPSYDEAMNQQEQGEPPSFEEALGCDNEQTSSSAHPSGNENVPLQESPASPSTSSSNLNSPEALSDSVPLTSHSMPGDSRLIRSLRALFGGRSFRTDAVYCRFVPVEDESSDSGRREPETERSGESADDLTDVLARAGLC